jgi:hypothetical protein
MSEKNKLPRRDFLKQAAVVVGAAAQGTVWPTHADAEDKADDATQSRHKQELSPTNDDF